MIGTDRVGLAEALERMEVTLHIGDAGEGACRGGGVDTADTETESVGEIDPTRKGKVARVGVTIASGGRHERWPSRIGGMIVSIGLGDVVRSFALSQI